MQAQPCFKRPRLLDARSNIAAHIARAVAVAVPGDRGLPSGPSFLSPLRLEALLALADLMRGAWDLRCDATRCCHGLTVAN